jgi:hypothetical protein
MIPEFVTVWVCLDCGSYYASSSTGDLTVQMNTNSKGEPTFPRARCPTMLCALKETMRIPMKVPLDQIQSEPPTSASTNIDSPHWSNERCGKCGKPLIVTGDVLSCSGCNSSKVATSG